MNSHLDIFGLSLLELAEHGFVDRGRDFKGLAGLGLDELVADEKTGWLFVFFVDNWESKGGETHFGQICVVLVRVLQTRDTVEDFVKEHLLIEKKEGRRRKGESRRNKKKKNYKGGQGKDRGREATQERQLSSGVADDNAFIYVAQKPSAAEI